MREHGKNPIEIKKFNYFFSKFKRVFGLKD